MKRILKQLRIEFLILAYGLSKKEIKSVFHTCTLKPLEERQDACLSALKEYHLKRVESRHPNS